MKRLILSVMVFLMIAAFASSAQAQISFGARGGVNVGNGGDAFVGAQAELSLPLLPITVVPNIDYYLVKATSVNSNLDVQYTFIGVGVAKLVAGGGYTLGYNKSDVKGAKATTDSGFNLQFGAKASLGISVFGLIRTTKIGSADLQHSLVVGITF